MSYLYENSNAESFQKFAQALLLPEFPGLQCFPVGQPDGGRDAMQPSKDVVVQVKFKRREEDAEVTAQWMIKALEGELEKVRRLAAAGAKSYLMVTNAAGTAHLEVGRIDLVQQWIDDNLPIPGQCLWRDDLDARFDRAPASLKFMYPEMLTGKDGIQLAIEGAWGAQRKRQLRTIRAFTSTQYQKDELVKFKQVSLSNSLLDLFVDVPVLVPEKVVRRIRKDDDSTDPFGAMEFDFGTSRYLGDDGASGLSEMTFFLSEYGASIGTADLLLGDIGQKHLKSVVLQGAPGQGKSTLAQYVCQVHRARYLEKTSFVDALQPGHRAAGFRLPIKVDLRDFAGYLDGKSPFGAAGDSDDAPSLERFLAKLIVQDSGGLRFDVDDLMDLVATMPILLFLDGLDEVADLDSRRKLVSSVVQSLTRMADMEADIQVVITSRPSLFGDAPSLAKAGFTTLVLRQIGEEIVTAYADKWVCARGLDNDEQKSVKLILQAKLGLSHIRELTRNPMQLTILLSLIHSVGYSLPDERTDLYKQYVELFLTREAEKTPTVRDHRALLVEFIQYLAWSLQSQAEASNGSGSVTRSELRSMIEEFLVRGHHPVDIVEDLFSKGLERIFVLVERIEGSYEFEVQPLREFFCARYLYETAPIGTLRHESPNGDRAQRFEAMARNPLWTNVTRFYAGSYDRGELADLLSSFKAMLKTRDFALQVHLRRLALALLTDWVFRAKKRVQDELIEVCLDPLGIVVACSNPFDSTDVLQLDPDCGQESLRRQAFESLESTPIGNNPYPLCTLLRLNGGRKLKDEFVTRIEALEGAERSGWIERMIRSGAARDLTAAEVWNLIDADGPSTTDQFRRCATLLSIEPVLAHSVGSVVETLISGSLSGHSYYATSQSRGALFSFVSSMRLSAVAIRPARLAEQALGRSREETYAMPIARHAEKIKAFLLDTLEHDAAREAADLEHTLSEWNFAVETSRRYFGESWVSYSRAMRAAGITSKTEKGKPTDSLFDDGIPLCERARFARLRRGDSSWWADQVVPAEPEAKMFWVGMVVLWSSAASYEALRPRLESHLAELSADEYGRLYQAVLRSSRIRGSRADRKLAKSFRDDLMSPRLAGLHVLAFHTDLDAAEFSVEQKLLPQIDRALRSRDLIRAVGRFKAWNKSRNSDWLALFRDLRANGIGVPHNLARTIVWAPMPTTVAATIIETAPWSYLPDFAQRAYATVEYSAKTKAVASVALDEQWDFD